MAHPTDNAITLIRNYVNTSISGSFSNNDIYLVERLNNPYYSPNPVLQNFVYTNFTAPTIFGVLSPSSVKNVLDSPGTATAVLPLLNTLPHSNVDVNLSMVWAAAYESAGIVTPQEYVSITGIINKVQPDSSYMSGISWSQVYLGRPCDLDDIEACR